MTWLRWIEHFSGTTEGALALGIPLTLVTLRVTPEAETDEIEFCIGAEYAALLE